MVQDPDPRRFPELRDEAMSELQRQVADEIRSGPRGVIRGPFQVLLHAPELARRVQAVGEYLRFHSALPRDVIEVAVLVTAQRWRCAYVQSVHAQMARAQGVSDSVLQALAAGEAPAGLGEAQAAAWALCRELHATGEVGDEAFAQAQRLFGREGVLDLLAICGYYTTLAMVLNVARVPAPGA